MSSIDYAELASRFPSERRAIRRLEGLVEPSLRSGRPPEFPFERLMDELEPASREVLALLLTALVRQGVARQIVRVQRAGSQGAGEFSSVLDVPPELRDLDGTTFEVKPEDLTVVYRFEKRA